MRYLHTILLLLTPTFLFSQIDTTKVKQLNEVIIKTDKKAVEQKADRIIYSFSNQTYLNSGTLMEGLKKLPGLIISDVAGMVYQGKQLEVYMDGRPLNMYSDELNTFLESLPANTVEKVEIITQPGAEFPATSGNAIINIITSKNAKKYITATYSNGYGYTNYDKSRHRFNNSVLVNAKNKLFAWQVQLGQSYSEKYQIDSFKSTNLLLSNNYSDKVNRLYFVKTGIKFNIKKDRVLINYDFNTSNNSANLDANGYNFASDNHNKNKRNFNDVMVIYQKRFENSAEKLDFSFNYNNSNSDLNSRNNNSTILDNNSTNKFYQFKTDFSNEFKFLDKPKFSTGFLADKLDFTTKNFDVKNLDYTRNTYALYSEMQSSYKSFDFILGGRLESYKIFGNTDTSTLNTFKQTRFFPNATIQYNISEDIFFNVNYNKKITLPNTSSLNPNNTSYQNQNITFSGNPNLNPTIFNNVEMKFSAFQYFTIGYSVSTASNQIATRIVENTSGVANVTENIPNVTIQNFNFGLPIPFMLFTQGLKKTLEFDFNPDKINFIYFYTDYQKNYLKGITNKGYWDFNIMMQILLPKDINFTTNYNTSTSGGNYYYYYVANNRLNEEVDITLSKKFLSNNLSVSIYCNDIFNTNYKNIAAVGTDYSYYNKYDSRRLGFSLSYKFPTKKGNVKEENIIPIENKEEKNSDK